MLVFRREREPAGGAGCSAVMSEQVLPGAGGCGVSSDVSVKGDEDARAPGVRRFRDRARASTRLLAACGWLAAGGLGVGGIVGHFWPAMEPLEGASATRLGIEFVVILAQTFRFHAALAVVCVLVLAVCTVRLRLAVACVPTLVLGFGPIVEAEVGRWTIGQEARAAVTNSAPDSEAAAGAARGSITVMSANVLVGDDRDPEPFLSMVRAQKPDVLVIQEWTETWESRAGAALDEMYPHKVIAVGHGAYGQRVASRLRFLEPPVLAARFSKGQPWRDPQVRFRVAFGSDALTIQNIHTRSPSPLRRFEAIREQRAQMRDLIAWAATVEGPTLVVGDFNWTPESRYSSEMEDSGFRESNEAAGRLRGSTWPRLGKLRFIPGIRLDQAYGKDVSFVESRVMDDIGSDHAPILVRVMTR